MREGSKEKIKGRLCFLFLCRKGPKIIASPVWNIYFPHFIPVYAKQWVRRVHSSGKFSPESAVLCSQDFQVIVGIVQKTRIYLQRKIDQKFLFSHPMPLLVI